MSPSNVSANVLALGAGIGATNSHRASARAVSSARTKNAVTINRVTAILRWPLHATKVAQKDVQIVDIDIAIGIGEVPEVSLRD